MPVVHTERPSDILIAIMGATGTGKSSFIRLIVDDESVVIGNGLESTTSDVKEVTCFESNGRCVRLVDTPGFDDNREGMTDTVILGKISEFLANNYKPGEQKSKLNGIIYLHRITDPRMSGVSVRNMRMMQKLCGEDSLKNVVVVTTRWDELTDESIGVSRENEMKVNPNFFQPLVARSAQFLRHNNTPRSASNIVAQILRYETTTLQLQREIAAGKKLEETAAGATLKDHFKEIVSKHKEDMERVRQEHEEALRDKEIAWQRELENERIKLTKKLEEIEGAKKGLEERVQYSEETVKDMEGRIEDMRKQALSQREESEVVQKEYTEWKKNVQISEKAVNDSESRIESMQKATQLQQAELEASKKELEQVRHLFEQGGNVKWDRAEIAEAVKTELEKQVSSPEVVAKTEGRIKEIRMEVLSQHAKATEAVRKDLEGRVALSEAVAKVAEGRVIEMEEKAQQQQAEYDATKNDLEERVASSEAAAKKAENQIGEMHQRALSQRAEMEAARKRLEERVALFEKAMKERDSQIEEERKNMQSQLEDLAAIKKEKPRRRRNWALLSFPIVTGFSIGSVLDAAINFFLPSDKET